MAKKKIIVFDVFAGSFSVSKAAYALENLKPHSQLEIVHIFAIEISETLCQKAPTFQNKGDRFFKLYCGNMFNNEFVWSVLKEFEQELKIAFSKVETEIDGILVVGGPPCTYYTLFQLGSGIRTTKKNPTLFMQKQFKADRLVLRFLSFFQEIVMVASHFKNVKTQKRPFCTLVMENPWSANFMNLDFDEDLFAKNKKTLQIPLSLRTRGCLQPFLLENGGFLTVTKHYWCEYDFENFPAKPTAIFSTLKNLEDKICSHRKNGNHKVTVEKLETSELRARYPQEFIFTLFFAFEEELKNNEK